jgi:hypothetical protein
VAVKELAEAVILQSIEDLWDKDRKEACGFFFCGQGFSFWADAAGIKIPDRRKLLSLVMSSLTQGGSFTGEIQV